MFEQSAETEQIRTWYQILQSVTESDAMTMRRPHSQCSVVVPRWVSMYQRFDLRLDPYYTSTWVPSVQAFSKASCGHGASEARLEAFIRFIPMQLVWSSISHCLRKRAKPKTTLYRCPLHMSVGCAVVSYFEAPSRKFVELIIMNKPAREGGMECIWYSVWEYDRCNLLVNVPIGACKPDLICPTLGPQCSLQS